MEFSLQDLDYLHMPKWFKINETKIIPSLENEMNELRHKFLIRNNVEPVEGIETTPPSLATQCSDKAIAFAIRRYGLRRVTTEDPDASVQEAKRQRTDQEAEENIVESAIGSAIAEKGLR